METIQKKIDDYLQKYGIQDIVDMVGYVDFKDSIKRMVGSSFLLLFGDRYGLQVSGKVYEYLAARRPILTLASTESEVAFLVSDNNVGIALDPGDLQGIENAILDFYNHKWKKKRSLNMKKYTRKSVAGKLADELGSILSENGKTGY